MPPTTRPLIRTLEQTYRQSTIHRAPWTCSACSQGSRTFTTTPKRPQENEPNSSTTTTTQQKPSSHFSLFPQTFGLSGTPTYTPNLRTLRAEFLTLQSKTHPDRAPSPSLKAAYEASSAALNTAYRTLQDPLKRAQYILSLQNIDVEDESAKMEEEGDAELLMEVMEAREAVDEVSEEAELVGIKEENDQRIAKSVGVLEEAFDAGDLERARREAVKLRYWVNIDESIRGWEEGKGGGLVHH